MITKIKDIRISDFDYPLDDNRIARHPLADRDSCRLLVSRSPQDTRHVIFSDIANLLQDNSLLVCNNTRVINARMKFEKSTGSKIEIFLLEPIDPEDYVMTFQSHGRCRWSCLVGNLKRWKEDALCKTLNIDGNQTILKARRLEPLRGNAHVVEFEWDDSNITFASIVDAAGFIPIPPYLKRESESSDADDYQTVYARIKGSVAAPTAGLHFTHALFNSLAQKGIKTENVTLHVGAGTFQPVKSEEIGEHPMHTEVFCVGRPLILSLIDALEMGKQITAVGTTTVRTLESLPYVGLHLLQGWDPTVSQWEAYERKQPDSEESLKKETIEALRAILAEMDKNGSDSLTTSTSIMIAPGFRWRMVKGMVTNFHQPKSTLLLLVASFLGDNSSLNPRWKRLYEEALKNNYRFLSYGDACYFER